MECFFREASVWSRATKIKGKQKWLFTFSCDEDFYKQILCFYNAIPDIDAGHDWRVISASGGQYEVNECGWVRNVKTKKVLRQSVSMHGYRITSFRDSSGKLKTFSIHRLVADAFLGTCPDGYAVNHIDGNKLNDHYSNLEYVTYSENMQHAWATGLRKPLPMSQYAPKGEEHYNAILTEEMVKEIWRIRKETGYGCRRIAKMLNVTYGAVDSVLGGKTWKWLNPNLESEENVNE